MAEQARDARASEEAADERLEPGSVGADVKAAASDLKSTALDQGRQLYEEVKQQATSYADARKNEAAGSVSDIASSLRATGRNFDEQPSIRAFVDSAADGLEQLAGGLRERSFADLYGEAESYARRSPALVAATAAVAGFVLARFIKSSADDLSESAATARAEARRLRARASETES